MADIVNLRRFRKAKLRADKAEEAAQNRVTHGLTKDEKADAKREQADAKAKIDGHRLENETDSD